MSALWAEPDAVVVRRLSRDRLHDCLALAADRGWRRTEHKWRLLFDLGEVYGICDSRDRLVATTVLTRYGTGLCTVSMVLVAARLGGQGLGTRIMSHVVARTGEAVVTLYATSSGRPLYEKMGFTMVADNVTHSGRFQTADEPVTSRLATVDDLPAVAALDTRVHGADRSALVRRLPRFCSQLRVFERDGRITGYAGAWDNVDKVIAGPVVCDDAHDAKALLSDLARGAQAPIRLEVLHEFGELGAWAVQRGLAPCGTAAYMVLNGRRIPGDATRRFCPVSVELG